jgi:hypothetical protein
MPKKINFKKESFILAHRFRSYSLWLAGSIVSMPVVRQNAVVEGQEGAELFTLW